MYNIYIYIYTCLFTYLFTDALTYLFTCVLNLLNHFFLLVVYV